MNSLISICIPAYNNSLYIAETIQSILDQSYIHFEIIIIDDCSTDSTWEIINSFSDPRLIAYKNDHNLGMHGNWQKALSHAKGDYIKLVCGDDILYPTCLEQQITVFEQADQNDVVLVGARRKIIKGNGDASPGAFYKFRPGKYSGAQAIRYCVAFGTNLIGEPMSVLFKSSVFKQHAIILGSNNYLIDLDLYAKLLKHGSLVMLPDYLSAFRIYATSMSGSLGWKHANYFVEFIRQKQLKKDFHITWYQKLMGTFLTYSLTFARNSIIKWSAKKK